MKPVIPPMLYSVLGETEPPRGSALSMCVVSQLMPLPKNVYEKYSIPLRLYPVITWARSWFGTGVDWRALRGHFCCPVDALTLTHVGRHIGMFLDDHSREDVQALTEHIDAPSDWKYSRSEWEMVMFLWEWYTLPRFYSDEKDPFLNAEEDREEEEDTLSTSQSPSTNKKRRKQSHPECHGRFLPRAFVKGVTLTVPYIWIHIEEDGNFFVRESTVIHPDYRIMRVAEQKNILNMYALSSTDMPVYAGFSRKLVFSDEIGQRINKFPGFGRPTPVSGKAALLSHLIETESSLLRHDEDVIHGRLNKSRTQIVEVITHFDVDLSIHWSRDSKRVLSVRGEHANLHAFYYVLLTGKGVSAKEVALYALHNDALREADEATGLDVTYRHPVIVDKISNM